jgi:hypothetical protein
MAPRDHRVPITLSLALLLPLAASCSSTRPVAPEALTDPAMREIQVAFAQTVERAKADPSATWRSGWFGNLGVILGGDDDHGLCYEWQGLVHGGVKETVARVGWKAVGVNVNQGTSSEHHALIVYDPGRIARGDLLHRPEESGAYVLDAWQRGEPDIFPLDAWLRMPFLVRVPPRLETPYTMESR